MSFKFKVGDKEYEQPSAEDAVRILTKTLEKQAAAASSSPEPKPPAQSWEEYAAGKPTSVPKPEAQPAPAPGKPTKIFRDPNMFMRGLMTDPEDALKAGLREILGGRDLTDVVQGFDQSLMGLASESRQSRLDTLMESASHLDRSKVAEVVGNIVAKDFKGVYTASNMKKALTKAYENDWLTKPAADTKSATEAKTDKASAEPKKPQLVDFSLMDLEDSDSDVGEMDDKKLLELAAKGDLDKVEDFLDKASGAVEGLDDAMFDGIDSDVAV